MSNNEGIEKVKDDLKRCKEESDRYWRKSNRMEDERDRARKQLKIIQQVLDGHIYKLAEEK